MTNELIAIFGMGVTILGSIGFAWRDLHRDLTGVTSQRQENDSWKYRLCVEGSAPGPDRNFPVFFPGAKARKD